MLFKLVSNGNTTQVEMDGKQFNDLTAVSFSHRRDGSDYNDCRVTLEFNITAKSNEDVLREHVFEDVKPGEFADRLKNYERAFEDPETIGKDPPETQAMIENMESQTGAWAAPATKQD